MWTLGVEWQARPIRPLDLGVCSRENKNKNQNHEIQQAMTGYESATKELNGTDRIEVGEHSLQMGAQGRCLN